MKRLFPINDTTYRQEGTQDQNGNSYHEMEHFSLVGCPYPRGSADVNISVDHNPDRQGAVNKRHRIGIETMKDVI